MSPLDLSIICIRFFIIILPQLIFDGIFQDKKRGERGINCKLLSFTLQIHLTGQSSNLYNGSPPFMHCLCVGVSQTPPLFLVHRLQALVRDLRAMSPASDISTAPEPRPASASASAPAYSVPLNVRDYLPSAHMQAGTSRWAFLPLVRQKPRGIPSKS